MCYINNNINSGITVWLSSSLVVWMRAVLKCWHRGCQCGWVNVAPPAVSKTRNMLQHVNTSYAISLKLFASTFSSVLDNGHCTEQIRPQETLCGVLVCGCCFPVFVCLGKGLLCSWLTTLSMVLFTDRRTLSPPNERVKGFLHLYITLIHRSMCLCVFVFR